MYSQVLTGASGQQVGVAKSYKVYPGDKVRIEAYAKYLGPPGGTNSNLAGFASALLGAFGLSAPAGGEAGTPSAGVNSYGNLIAAGTAHTNDGSYPKAFVNLLVFDKNYNYLDFAWDQINGGEQIGASPKAAHDFLAQEYTAKEEGYIYVYVSNENPTLVDVYFDDVAVIRTRSRLIQGAEYYAYGMQTAGSWTRDGETENNFLANGGTELNRLTGLYDLDYRQYDPVLGRMNQVDPAAAKYASLSPYNFGFNNPVMWNDPFGADPHDGDNGSEDDFYLRRSRQPGGMYGFGGEGQTIDPQTYFGGSTGEANFNELARYGFGGNPFALFDMQRDEWISHGIECEDPEAFIENERRKGNVARISSSYIVDILNSEFTLNSKLTIYHTTSTAEYGTNDSMRGGTFTVPIFIDFSNPNAIGEPQYSLLEKSLIFVNSFNPVAIAWDAILGVTTGKDRFGTRMSGSDQLWNAASLIPIGKFFRVGKSIIRSDALTHIFRKAMGHVNPQTLTSQMRYLKLFDSVASDPNNLVNTRNAEAAANGIQTFIRVFNSGEVWVHVRNGVIFDAGVNLLK